MEGIEATKEEMALPDEELSLLPDEEQKRIRNAHWNMMAPAREAAKAERLAEMDARVEADIRKAFEVPVYPINVEIVTVIPKAPSGKVRRWLKVLNEASLSEVQAKITHFPPGKTMEFGLTQGLTRRMFANVRDPDVLDALAAARRTFKEIPRPPASTKAVGQWWAWELFDALKGVSVPAFIKAMVDGSCVPTGGANGRR